MCGILVTNDPIKMEDLEPYIIRRGPDSSTIFHEDGFSFLQSVLSIREKPKENLIDELKRKEIIVLYNGEIFCNNASDTDFVLESILMYFVEKSDSCSQSVSDYKDNIIEIFEKVEKIHRRLNNFENEYSLVIYDKENKKIFFFGDDIGRRSIGFEYEDPNTTDIHEKYTRKNSNSFLISSCGYSTPVNPSCFYCYDINENKLFFRKKNSQSSIMCFNNENKVPNDYFLNDLYSIDMYFKDNFDIKKITNNIVQDAIKLLKKSAIKKTIDLTNGESIVFAFSGGLDSFITVILLDEILESKINFILINTFFSVDAYDYNQAKENFSDLSLRMKRKIKFVENMIEVDTINENILQIEKLVGSKRLMDINIGIIHFFTARKAREFGKIIFNGNGADEIFAGYSKYTKQQEKNVLEQKSTEDSSLNTVLDYQLLKSDIMNIYKNNIHRDDRIITHNQMEMRSLFLDKDLFRFIFSLISFIEKSDIKDSISEIHNHPKKLKVLFSENKKILRVFLNENKYISQALLKKKAMQFGTKLKILKKKIKYSKY